MMYNDYLEHHGIKGQKWGVRRFQREDGTLTPAGKKRYNIDNPKDREKLSREYKSYMVKATKQVYGDEVSTDRYVNAYNSTVRRFNGENGEEGLTEKYNKDYERKLSAKDRKRDWGLDEAYNQGYQKLWDKEFNKTYETMLLEDIEKDKNYRKAQALVKEYSMTEWDELAKGNEAELNAARKKYKR